MYVGVCPIRSRKLLDLNFYEFQVRLVTVKGMFHAISFRKDEKKERKKERRYDPYKNKSNPKNKPYFFFSTTVPVLSSLSVLVYCAINL